MTGHLIKLCYDYRLLLRPILLLSLGLSLSNVYDSIILEHNVTKALIWASPILLQALSLLLFTESGSGRFKRKTFLITYLYGLEPYYYTLNFPEPDGEFVKRDDERQIPFNLNKAVFVNGKYRIQ